MERDPGKDITIHRQRLPGGAVGDDDRRTGTHVASQSRFAEQHTPQSLQASWPLPPLAGLEHGPSQHVVSNMICRFAATASAKHSSPNATPAHSKKHKPATDPSQMHPSGSSRPHADTHLDGCWTHTGRSSRRSPSRWAKWRACCSSAYEAGTGRHIQQWGGVAFMSALG
jgi:hypothetical protein